MLDRIRSLFGSGASPRSQESDRSGAAWDRSLAAAALLVEAALLDGTFADKERAAIEGALARHFGLTAAEARALIQEAEKAQAEANHLVRFTRVLKEAYGPDERTGILEMLWEVAYADGVLHHYESNLLRRISGLLYVSDRDAGAARKRVLARLGLEDLPPA
ncbi:MAG: TerB family tellurite resistance protein [Alphaproteobacteria bacterium]|nr:TerB family tellurite resistance protein [Alphaproteobacteria bacterium]